MRKVYSAADVMLVGRLKSALEAKGVECVLKNANLHGGVSAKADQPTKPELWILDDTKLMLANRLLDTILVTELSHCEPWKCVTCGQELENQFSDCWNCGTHSEIPATLEDETDDDEADDEE